jgi:hypothetical protein
MSVESLISSSSPRYSRTSLFFLAIMSAISWHVPWTLSPMVSSQSQVRFPNVRHYSADKNVSDCICRDREQVESAMTLRFVYAAVMRRCRPRPSTSKLQAATRRAPRGLTPPCPCPCRRPVEIRAATRAFLARLPRHRVQTPPPAARRARGRSRPAVHADPGPSNCVCVHRVDTMKAAASRWHLLLGSWPEHVVSCSGAGRETSTARLLAGRPVGNPKGWTPGPPPSAFGYPRAVARRAPLELASSTCRLNAVAGSATSIGEDRR